MAAERTREVGRAKSKLSHYQARLVGSVVPHPGNARKPGTRLWHYIRNGSFCREYAQKAVNQGVNISVCSRSISASAAGFKAA